jgi:N-acetylglutamate synthase-like GNAT family acetyltransferase
LCYSWPVRRGVPVAQSTHRAQPGRGPLEDRREVDASIRQATSEDTDSVARIIRNSFRDVAERFNLDPENAPTHPSNCRPDWIRRDLARGVSYYLLSSSGSLAGCVALEIAASAIAYVERLGVLPDRRGRGFGAALLRHALHEARSAGVSVVSVGVIAENTDLVSWYEHLGFEQTATRRFRHLPFTVSYLEHVIS